MKYTSTEPYFVNAGWFLLLLFFILLPFGAVYNAPLGVLVVTGLYSLAVKYPLLIKDKHIRLYLYLFLCIYIPMVISLPDAINFTESARKVSGFILYIFTGISIICFFKCEKSRKYFLMSFGILLTLWMLDAIYQYVTGTNLLGYPYDKINGNMQSRLTGVFYPDQRIGIVLAILSPVYFEFIRVSLNKINIAWLLVLPLFFVILLGGSRSSWFMIFLSGLLYAIYFIYSDYHKTIQIKSIAAGILVLAILSAGLYVMKPLVFDTAKSFLAFRLSTIEYNPDDSEKFNSLEQRVQLWETGLRIVPDHWINGIGVRGYRYIDKQEYIKNKKPVVSDVARLSTHPHQVTLEVLVETGIIGILGYLLFWFILLKSMFTNARHNQQLEYMPWCIAVIIAMFPLNMHKSFYEHFSSSIIWVLVALAIAFYPANKKIVMDNLHK